MIESVQPMQKPKRKKNVLAVEYICLDEQEKFDRAFSILFEEVERETLTKGNGSLLSTPEMASMYNQVYTVFMEYLTNDEVAKSLRVNPRTVDRWLKHRLIRGYKLGDGKTALWRIPKSEVKKFLEKHSNK